MNKTALFDFMRQCPQLVNLFGIAGTEEAGASVITPLGASEAWQISELKDVISGYSCEMIPFTSVYEDFQINCYRLYDNKDSFDINALTYEEVESVCKWIEEQDYKENFPQIGEQVISIECVPFVPQIAYVNEQENTIAYFITLRVRYVNRRKKKYIEYASND